MPVTASMDADDGPMVFSSNPKDYNRVTCLACMAMVKVHHMRKHMVDHGLDMAEYKAMYGEEYQYVRRVHHKCGICKQAMLFDLDTLYSHVSSFHQVKVKEYVDLYLGPIADMESALNNQTKSQTSSFENVPVDEDGAPIIGLNLKRTLEIAEDQMTKKSKLSNSNTQSVDSQNNIALVSAEDAPEGQVPNCYKTNYLERIQDRDNEGNLISNDFADYALVECKICLIHTPLTRLRSHTKSAHKTTITEYKAQFGSDLVPLEIINHRCGICEELVLLDSDHIAVHLKRPGHYITHKNYNDGYMVDSRSSKYNMTKRVFRDKPSSIQFPQLNQPQLNIKERSRRKARIPYDEAEYDLSNFIESPSPTHEQDEFDDFGEPTVVMENIEHDIIDEGDDVKPPVFKSLQLSSNTKLEVIMLDDLDDSGEFDYNEGGHREQEVEEIVLDSDDEDNAKRDSVVIDKKSNHINDEQDSVENEDTETSNTDDASIGVFVDIAA
eukprot:GFUD01008938.1.p1 GENE.GFUD01008938.1~~GFUD01008938.1.p1  ORF type:complete len:495 (+),score=161.34 GFUD01008938.1:44-1528(+)